MKRIDLENRTLDFSKSVIKACHELPRNESNRVLVNQLLRSATSIGANYREANGALSKKDFKNKIHICKKEAHESHYWLALLRETNQSYYKSLGSLIDESRQFILIFGKITSTLSKETKDP